MFILMCVFIIAVFHLDEYVIMSNRLRPRRKALCSVYRYAEFTDPDGRLSGE